MHWLLYVSVAAACVLRPAAPAEYLLPGDTPPHHYSLKYAFDIDPNTNFSFYGVVDILVSLHFMLMFLDCGSVFWKAR